MPNIKHDDPSQPARIANSDIGAIGGQTSDHTLEDWQAILEDGETIRLCIKPSLWYLLIQSLFATAVIAICGWLTKQLWPHFPPRDLWLLGFFAQGLASTWYLMLWIGTTYVLTDRRAVVLNGLRKVHVTQLMLPQIQTVAHVRHGLQHVFGIGDLHFIAKPNDDDASGSQSTLLWHMIGQSKQTHEIVLQWITKMKG